MMIDILFDLGDLAANAASDLAVDAASDLAVNAASDLAVNAASDLAVDVASNLSGIFENGLAEVAGPHLAMVPRALDLVAETLEKNLGGDDKGSADA